MQTLILIQQQHVGRVPKMLARLLACNQRQHIMFVLLHGTYGSRPRGTIQHESHRQLLIVKIFNHKAPLGVLFFIAKGRGEMSENEGYGLRLEKKIDNMQSDIRMLSDHVTRLTFINEAQKNAGEENRKDIDALDVKVSDLEKKSAAQDGGIGVLRFLLGLCGGSLIGLCAWVGSSIIQINQDQSLIKEKVTRLEEMNK